MVGKVLSSESRDAASFGALLYRSDSENPEVMRLDALLFLFAVQRMGGGSIGIQHNGAVIYEVLSSGGYRFKTHSRSIVNITRKAFLKQVSRVLKPAADSTIIKYPAWINPAPFSAVCYGSKGRYLSGSEAPGIEMPQKELRRNVEFCQSGAPSSAIFIEFYKLLAVRVLQNLKYGQKLFIDYGNN